MNRPEIRVLYLLPAEGFGGAERQGAYHIAELPRHGIETTAFAGPGDPIALALRELNAPYRHFEHFPGRPPLSLSLFGRLRNGTSWLRQVMHAVTEIERRIQGRRFDLIFANRTVAWLIAAALSDRLGVPYAIRAGSRPAHPILPLGLDLLGRFAAPRAAFYNCRAVLESISPHLRCPAFLLPNAVDLRRFAPASRVERLTARARLGLPHDGRLVGLAARPAPEKGFDFLAKIAGAVRSGDPRSRFVVAGEFTYRSYYEERLRASGIGDSFHFLGHVASMPDFFKSMDLVVLTSRERSIEASPNALLEAMATGRPIVATAVGGVPELVEDAAEGYLVKDGDAATFAARVLELLADPRRREALGRRGRARAEEHAVSRVVSDLARHIRRLVSPLEFAADPRLGATSCKSITPSVQPSTYWSAVLPSKPSSSSPDAAI